MSEKMATETVYVTTTISNEDSHVMSEKVQSLAGSIYKEFEKVIKKYDEDVVKDLMPLVVGILEALDASFVEKQELDVELELVREDNEQLLTQYEREKQLRKGTEQKFLEMEDNMEGTKKELEDKVETLESIIRMSEVKAKNTSDLVTRLEEKEQESKIEYNKLHDRYTELFRTHMDYMERTKVLLGTDKLPEMTPLSHKVIKSGFNLHPVSVSYGNTIELHKHEGALINFEAGPHQPGSNVNLRSELNAQISNSYMASDKEQLMDSINVTEIAAATRLNQTLADIIASTPELAENHDLVRSHGSLENLSSIHNDRSMYEEIQATDIAEVDFGVGISDSDKEDEEEDEETKDNDRDSVGDNFYGMCRELENLILENTELLATKNALNILKDDLITKIDVLTSEQEVLREEIVILNSVRRKLQERVSHLEQELKKLKEEIGKKEKEEAEKEEGGEEDIPMAQRKRFTRVEMARVLMERNQYKERLMELQEAIRWTEMMRASKEHPGELQTKKKSGAWNFFGNLFSSSNKPKPNAQVAVTKYNIPGTSTQPGVDTDKKPKGTIPKSNSYDFLQDDLTSEKVRKEKEKERREQYKQVRALVTKDDGRLQAYGWSLPAKLTSSVKDSSDKFQVPVPVPVYCRPLFDCQTGWKIWCASGVNLTGGQNKDGSEITETSTPRPSQLPQVDSSSMKPQVGRGKIKGTDIDEMSSLVWICTADHESSQVSVISANNPADILETFFISVSHILCIASVQGALDSDFPYTEDALTVESPTGSQRSAVVAGSSPGCEGEHVDVGEVSIVHCAAEETDPLHRFSQSPRDSEFDGLGKVDDDEDVQAKGGRESSSDAGELEEGGDPHRLTASDDMSHLRVFRAEGCPATPSCTTPIPTSGPGGRESATDFLVDGRFSPLISTEESEKMSSALPTMWMGTHNGSIYVHSSVSSWKRCLHSVKLKDSVLGIVHVKGRVLVSLANGTVAVFHRAADNQWDLLNYHIIDLGQSRQSIRCMTVVDDKLVWCGYKNKIHIVCPQSISIQKSFDAHPRKESQVRQLCWVGDGVWVSIRLDSTLRLYHAYTHQHLQDVDVEPYVSKMLGTGKLGFSFVRITAMLISCNRLWIGTSNGVIISVPLSESDKQPMIATSASLDGPSGSRPGGVVRVYSEVSTDSTVPSTFIPYCSMAQAQLSFHGHKDAVKFFVSVPETPHPSLYVYMPGTNTNSDVSPLTSDLPASVPSKARLILSGGEGYVDFRLGDVEDGDQASTTSASGEEDAENPGRRASLTKVDSSHVIVWQVTTQD